MTDISLLQYARLLGSNTVIGMAERVGLKPPPPPISVRNLIDLAGRIILPFAPVDLQPQNGARGIRNDPSLFFRDSGAGTRAAAAQFEFSVTQNNVLVDPTKRLTDLATTSNPLPPFGIKWFFPLPPGEVTLTVRAINKAGKGPKSSSIFSVTSSPVPQPPPPSPPPGLVGISKLSMFNCQGERHTVFVWVRDATGNGPWKPIQRIPTQFNEAGQCPFDDNGNPADSVAILTRKGEGGGVACISGNIYQVSIVDPERPTCGGQNDPNIINCVVEDRPSFFRFDNSGDEVTVMLENGRLSPVPGSG